MLEKDMTEQMQKDKIIKDVREFIKRNPTDMFSTVWICLFGDEINTLDRIKNKNKKLDCNKCNKEAMREPNNKFCGSCGKESYKGCVCDEINKSRSGSVGGITCISYVTRYCPIHGKIY